MKISGYSQNYINQTYTKPATNDRPNEQEGINKENQKTTETDSISLSQTTLDRQKIDKSIDNIQVGREEQVKALKEQVETGQYNINADKIAEKMIGFYMDDLA